MAIRSAISMKFAARYRCRMTRYYEMHNENDKNTKTQYGGNPALADEVTEYMMSLKKRKVSISLRL